MSNTGAIPEEVFDPSTLGLIVVDVQKAFVASDGTPAKKGLDTSMTNERLPNVKRLIETARETEMTVVYTRSIRRSDDRDGPGQVYDILPDVYEHGNPSCCAGTVDVEYVDGVTPRENEFEVTKKRYDAFRGTSLAWDLRSQNVETVIICGFMTDVCVESTARTAHEEGFNVIVASDSCAAASRDAHNASLRTVSRVLGATMDQDEIADRVAQQMDD